jgi:hypothetical protein
MRIVSAVISSAFIALTVMMVSTWRHRALPTIAVATAATPMVLFLAGTVNPNSVEITATLAAFTAILSAVAHPRDELLPQRAIIAAVSGVVAANMRGLSPAWVAVAVLAPFVLADNNRLRTLARSTAVRIAAAVVAAGAAFAVYWVLSSASLSAHNVDVPYAGASPLTGFGLMIAQLGNQLREMVGVFGWLDTAAPTEIYILWTLLIGGIVLLGLLIPRRRQRVFVVVLLLAFALLPALAQAAFIEGGGFIWQGRYSLPLLAILLVGAGSVLAEPFGRLELRIAIPLIVGFWTTWAVAQSYAFISTLHRYSVGTDGAWSDMLLRPDWEPPGGNIFHAVAFIAVAGTTSVLMSSWIIRRRVADAPLVG